MLDQLVVAQAQTSQYLWDHLMQTVRTAPGMGGKTPGKPASCIPKMTAEDDPETFLNSFVWSAQAAGWPEDKWVAILIPCLKGPAQQAVDTLFLEEVMDNAKYGMPSSKPYPGSLLTIIPGGRILSQFSSLPNCPEN